MNIWTTILNALFPRRCILCRNESVISVCEACYAGLAPERPHPSPWITSTVSYEDKQVQKLVRHLKTYPDIGLAVQIAHSMKDVVLEQCSDTMTMHGLTRATLVPIPIHQSRFTERGYNQALLIAQELEKLLDNIPVVELLKKIRKTDKQALIHTRGTRLQNPKGCFRAVPIHPKNDTLIILIDDVATTGATLAEAKHTLKVAGWHNIIACTFAH
ncbi:MAG: ComF family protein [Candidatus Pacebacteria bacterium]|nr:ComF family protein [Candidatus Paceibacterota bacterium]